MLIFLEIQLLRITCPIRVDERKEMELGGSRVRTHCRSLEIPAFLPVPLDFKRIQGDGEGRKGGDYAEVIAAQARHVTRYAGKRRFFHAQNRKNPAARWRKAGGGRRGRGQGNERKGRKIRARSVGREPWKNSPNFFRLFSPLSSSSSFAKSDFSSSFSSEKIENCDVTSLFSSIYLFLYSKRQRFDEKEREKKENTENNGGKSRRGRTDGIRAVEFLVVSSMIGRLFIFPTRIPRAVQDIRHRIRPNYADPGVNDDYASSVWQFRRQFGGGRAA